MKCLEKIILDHLVKATVEYHDPYQFAYRANRGTDDAVLTLLHRVYQHLDQPKTSVRMLFVDFSSAFNTIQPHLMAEKLINMHVDPGLVLWVLDFLIGRAQFVKVDKIMSTMRQTSTGAPQGCVISPVLYTLYTADCRPVSDTSSDILLKYADDECLVGLIREDSSAIYEEEVERLSSWCSENFLHMNVKKTKELVIDFRKNCQPPPTLKLNGEAVERVQKYKYLGLLIDDKLNWNDHADYVYKKGRQRLHFLKRLSKLKMSEKVLERFYEAVVRSVLSYCLPCYCGSLSSDNKRKLDRIIKQASKTIHVPLTHFDSLCQHYMEKKAQNILLDITHPLHSMFCLARSGRRYISLPARTTRFQRSFTPSAIRILNM